MRRRPPVAHLPAALVAVVLLIIGPLTGCGRGDAGEPTSSTAAPIGVTVFAPGERVRGPDLSGPTLAGGRIDIANLRGRVVVLNAWASWCAPCLEELPVLIDLSLSANPAALAVIGLDVRDDPDSARALVADLGVPYPSLLDPDGSLLARLPGVPPQAIPSTLVLDRRGYIAARIIGPVTAGVLAGVVDDVLAESSLP